MPYLYAPAPQRPGHAQGSVTHFRVFVGEGTPFEGGRGPLLEDLTDGAYRTIMVVESDDVVPWTKPDDLRYSPDHALPSLGNGPRGNFLVLMADGSVRFIQAKFNQVLLRQAITRNDKQPLDLDRLGTVDPRPAPPGARRDQ